jgi:uncharacterized SAM-binding protein YcdF (DUF218 family)
VSVRTAIVVPGNESRRRGGYRISRACLRLVREAERLAGTRPVEAVVFTGRSRGTGPSEAEQMRTVWTGAEVELVVEPTASRTAENAARTLPLLLERDIARAYVVCTPLHLFRARFLFSRLYEPHGIETSFRVPRMVPSLRAVAWELIAIPVVRRHLRGAEAELPPKGDR